MASITRNDLLDTVFVLVRMDVILIASAVALMVVGVLLRFRDGRAVGTISRPDLHTVPGYPFFGNIFHLIKHGDRQLEMFTALRKTHVDKTKAMSITVPGHRFIDITKPSASLLVGGACGIPLPPALTPNELQWIAYVQKTNFTNYQKGPTVLENLYQVLGDGIFAADGESWKQHRKATAKVFNNANFRGYINDTLFHEIEKLKMIIGNHADKEVQFDLNSLLERFALDSFGLILTGASVGALKLDSDALLPFSASFDTAGEILTRRFVHPFWRWTEWLNGDAKLMTDAAKVMDDFVYEIIDRKEKPGGEDSGDLLSAYMALRDDHGEPLSRQFHRDSVMNLLIAGRDSTAQSLSWSFFRLLTRPELIAPIRAEVDATGDLDYDNYRTLIQTQAVYHEGLRLHPPVPKNAWQALEDDHLPDGGPMIKKGDVVSWCDWEMGRFESVWGPDAAEFKPSRWINEKGELKQESQWKAHFFNGGARACPGRTLASFEAIAVLAEIVRDFDLTATPEYLQNVEMVDCEDTPRYASTLMLPMKEALMVTAAHRKREEKLV